MEKSSGKEISDSFCLFLNQVRTEDERSLADLWERYFRPLEASLVRHSKANADAEDIAQSTLISFCKRASRKEFPDLSSWNSLWGLLITIAARKAANRQRKETAQKRGGGRVQNASCFSKQESQLTPIDLAQSPITEADFNLVYNDFMNELGEKDLQEVAGLMLSGFSVSETVEKLKISRANVNRKRRLIKDLALRFCDSNDEH